MEYSADVVVVAAVVAAVAVAVEYFKNTSFNEEENVDQVMHAFTNERNLKIDQRLLLDSFVQIYNWQLFAKQTTKRYLIDF